MRPEIQRARDLRRTMSEPEVILWSRLKRLRERGFHIRRQAPFRGYYLDFVCYQRRLAIEVDGFQHSEDIQADHDLVRDRILAREGFRVMRFMAAEVRGNLGGVMDQIVVALEAAPSTRANGQSRSSALEARFPTLAASRPVPPIKGGNFYTSAASSAA